MLHDKIPRYKVWKHGDDYVDPESYNVVICPECGYEARNTEPVDNSHADYICDNCGCAFDCWDGYEPTTAGKVVIMLLNVFTFLFVILAAATVISGIAVAVAGRNKYGVGNVPDDVIILSLGLCVGGPLISCAVACGLCNLKGKI